MRKLHVKRGERRKASFRRIGIGTVCALLCLCMAVPFLLNFPLASASAASVRTAEATLRALNRLADPDTTDSYIGKLLSQDYGSRYAGRVWTDKSVLASGETSGDYWNGKVYTLDMTTDGIDGTTVEFDADFGTIFSALASSQVVNEWPPSPIDLVIALDMSASMAQDTRYAINNALTEETGSNTYLNDVSVEERTMAARIQNSRIQKTLDAVNETIDALMEQNKENRVSVVVYGAGAVVLMPLAHYARVDEQPYLSVGGMETLYTPDDLTFDSTYGWVWTRNVDACYTVTVNALKDDSDNPTFGSEPYKYIVSNNIDNSEPKSADVNGKTYTEKVIANPGYATWESVDPTHDQFSKDQQELKADNYVGYYTNTQGGIYLAYSQLALTEKTTFTGTLTTGKSITVARIPAAVIMTDGGANFAFNEMENWSGYYGGFGQQYFGDWKESPYFRDDDAAGDKTDYSHRLGEEGVQIGDEWYNVYLPGVKDGNKITSLYNKGALVDEGGTILGGNTLSSPPAWNHAGIFYSSDGDPFGTSGTVLETLLTAAYMRHVTETHYENGWDAGSATNESRSDLLTYTMSVDSKNVPQWGRMRLYPSLNPKEYSLDSDNEWWKNEAIFGLEDIGQGPDSRNKTAVYNGLKSSWQSWKNGNSRTDAQFAGTRRGYIEPLPTDGYTDSRFGNIKVTNRNVIDNIAYNDGFYDVESVEVLNVFKQILTEITGSVFVPVSGDNDAGVGDSLTYQDPLGEYMELKNQAVKTKTHRDSNVSTYDMAMLLFGEMHGLVRAGVYDYQWNDQYMQAKDPNDQGEKPFPDGWYYGDDPKTAIKAGDESERAKGHYVVVNSDNAGTYPAANPYTKETYTNAEEAWEDGWVMRFSFKTLTSFVPIVERPADDMPKNLSEQVKNTVYTCYRFAGDKTSRNALHRNPIYGDVPKELKEKWDGYGGSYPEDNKDYSDIPGVFRLSDIRVWNEHTGDFIDQSGAITPEDTAAYDDSLYVNIPVAAVPTQLAEITLGPSGPISYETNLDKEDQSTPFRIFYAVGLDEDLIMRDESGSQVGVDVSKISGEYVTSHTDPATNNIYFVSNWYSNSAYYGYSESEYGYSTRGDAAISFSPSVENRYYIFQKPLPLFAHAYRVLDDVGNIKPVDNEDGADWDANGAGNSKTKWEGAEEGTTGGNSWSGGEFIGTYDSEGAFKQALLDAKAIDGSGSGTKYIKDAKGINYPVPANIKDAVITLTEDQLDKVESKKESEGGGYTENSSSFESDDWFFLCIEYYLPLAGTTGKDINGKELKGTTGARAVSLMIARKGSAFGSGLHSKNIGNGDMLCWSDIGGNCTLEIEYNSRTVTGDNTRGEPTFEKLTLTGENLRTYLKNCGLSEKEGITEKTEGGADKFKSYLDLDCDYWGNVVQKDPRMQELIAQIKAARQMDYPDDPTVTNDDDAMRRKYDELFDWCVSARTGGIRVGDMYNNVQIKGGAATGATTESPYYTGNKTHTANNYYVPTLSETSTAGNGLVINNFLGNNGRLEVANANLMVTKTLVAPDGFTLTEEQQNETFDYQVYVQGLTGERFAQRLKWNPFSQSWQKRVDTLEILTDNSSLVISESGSRAMFYYDAAKGTTRQIVQYTDITDGQVKYCYADENGNALTDEPCEEPTANNFKNVYYMYLPSGEGHVYQLFGSDYESGTTHLEKAGTTAYYPDYMEGSLPDGHNDNQTFAKADDAHPAGTREYWTQEAVLIPYQEVFDAENVDDIEASDSGAEAFAVDAVDSEEHHWTYNEGITEGHHTLDKFTFVTVIPDTEGTDSTVYTPYRSRTAYMTTSLYFGYTAKLAEHLETEGETFATCSELSDYALKGENLYDQIIPTVDRPTLFNNTASKNNDTSDKVAANTAVFTLKNGEGLLLTGLGNRITYRFTEKLTDEQIAHGYTLKEISHIQQRDSDTVYVPGVQEIQVEGKSEPFAHTNATIWESYATMAAGALGNHHQPQASEGAAQNPSCLKQLDDGGCDLLQPDGSTRHYFYYGGKLVDPHYDGEMKGMSRYVLNPTAHFGVANENVTNDPATNPDSGYYDYTGVYSVYGDTGYFTEQSHYTNTWEPDALVVSKKLEGEDGVPLVTADKEKEFKFTLEVTFPDWIAKNEGTEVNIPSADKLHYWRGKTADLDKETDTAEPLKGGAPRPGEDEAIAKLPTLGKSTAAASKSDGTSTISSYTFDFTCKPDESIVIYGLPEGTIYKVTEVRDPDYPEKNDTKKDDAVGDEKAYIAEGMIIPSGEGAGSRAVFANTEEFQNVKLAGSLTVEKQLEPEADKETTFDFTVKLTPEKEVFEALKADSTKLPTGSMTPAAGTGSRADLGWKVNDDGTLVCTFSLKAGQRMTIDNIPVGTQFEVTEAKARGFVLKRIELTQPKAETPELNWNKDVEKGLASGTVAAGEARDVAVLFTNGPVQQLPQAGGAGTTMLLAGGALLLVAAIAALAALAFGKRRGRAR